MSPLVQTVFLGGAQYGVDCAAGSQESYYSDSGLGLLVKRWLPWCPDKGALQWEVSLSVTDSMVTNGFLPEAGAGLGKEDLVVVPRPKGDWGSCAMSSPSLIMSLMGLASGCGLTGKWG